MTTSEDQGGQGETEESEDAGGWARRGEARESEEGWNEEDGVRRDERKARQVGRVEQGRDGEGRVREKNAKGWKQAVSRRMGIQKVEVVQVGMEPVHPGLQAYARTEDKVRKMKVVAEEAARLSYNAHSRSAYCQLSSAQVGIVSRERLCAYPQGLSVFTH